MSPPPYQVNVDDEVVLVLLPLLPLLPLPLAVLDVASGGGRLGEGAARGGPGHVGVRRGDALLVLKREREEKWVSGKSTISPEGRNMKRGNYVQLGRAEEPAVRRRIWKGSFISHASFWPG